LIAIIACPHRLQRGQQEPITRRTRNAGIAAGIMRYGSSFVMGAFTLAPRALVCALRETGVAFAVQPLSAHFDRHHVGWT